MGAQAVRLSNVDIDNALKNKDFEVTFQPIFDLGNGALARVEAFVRWRHPSLGVLPPGAFISFFESQGRMSELTRYVLSQALSRYLDWRGPSAPGFSVNLALSDLSDEAFASHFSVLLRDRHFPADLITLECPMPPVTMAVAVAAEQFARLAATGARLAIEVRGRANDFLRMIEPFPFDEIKTGGAAILRFARTVRGPGLSAISELIDIANTANAAITAVGVEDQASLAALRSLGFAAAQGNHLGRVGALSAFLPSRVNEVRTLLGLDPLSDEDLHSLFRTEAPNLQQPETYEPEALTPEAHIEDDQDALVERLAARLARRSKTAEGASVAEPAPVREKPKLAAAKAAAIARVKRKAAERTAEIADMQTGGSKDAREGAQYPADPAAARQLQERLAVEFGRKVEDIAAPAEERPLTPMSELKHPDPDDDLDVAFVDNEAEEGAAPAADDANAFDFEENQGEATVEVSGDDPAAEPTVAGACAAGGFVRASLAVGRTGAYFRPGMRIGAAAPVSPPTDDQARAAPTARPAAPEASLAAAEFASASEPPVLDEPAPRPAGRRRKKNLLTRKYRIWPTHFWPRSWKRALRRSQTGSARPRSGENAAAAE